MAQRAVAALDLGSQTFRLAVAEVLEGCVRVPVSILRNVRLAEGLTSARNLSPAAMERGAKVLREFRGILGPHHPSRLWVCGTAALRLAGNASAFLDRARAEGFEVHVLSGEEEAALALRGVQATMPILPIPFLMADVGGGSSELVLVGAEGVLYSRSLDVGAVALTEAQIGHDPPLPGELKALLGAAGAALAGPAREIPEAPKAVVGLGGTAATLAALALGLSHYEPLRIRAFVLTEDRLAAQWSLLAALDTARRRQLPGLDPSRADIILAGLAIYRRILEATGQSELVVSDGGLLLGLLVTLLSEESQDAARTDPRGLYV